MIPERFFNNYRQNKKLAAIQKIFNTKRFRVFFVFLAFLLIAGFVFFANYHHVHADVEGSPVMMTEQANKEAAAKSGDGCGFKAWVTSPIVCSLTALLGVVAKFLQAAATTFGWVVKVGNMNALLNAGAGGAGGSVIYQLWTMVRDLLNIAFILVLLFSAFATIFQVEKFNYKKLLLNLILMALLVNFSYPIARFIIDVSNVLMYTLIRTLLEPQMPGQDAAKTFGVLTDKSGLTSIITPAGASITYLFTAIIFTFILAITLLAVAVMFIIRMVALTILIIFSPIAFVGSILPGKAASFASQWWDNLFKYAFFGPIMMFIIYIVVRIMNAMSTTAVIMSFTDSAKPNANDPNMVGAIAFFSIPIVLLWIGMSLGQKMGIAGAATVMGYAQKTGKWAAKLPWRGARYGANATGVPGGIKKGWQDGRKSGKLFGFDNKLTRLFKDKQPEREAQIAGGITGGRKGWANAEAKRRRAEKAKEVKEEADNNKGVTIESLSLAVNTTFDKGTGSLNPAAVNKSSAGSAQAFLDKNGDDRKSFVEDALQTKGGTKAPGSAGSGLENLFVGLPAGHPILSAGAKIAAGTASADELRQVTSYINRKSEEIVNHYSS